MDPFIWSVDPVLVSFGSLKIHWYGVLFATAILTGFSIMNMIYKHENKNIKELETLQIYIVIGIVVGARLGHCFFYNPAYYLSNPLEILAVWKGGLASHGGGIGAIIATFLYARKTGVSLIYLLDRLAIPTASFAFFVRMGNLMNSEIVGNPTNVAWGIVFTRVDNLTRHPAQLYEALSYLFIFIILSAMYFLPKKKFHSGMLFGVFLTLVFSARFIIEFVKVPQAAYAHDTFMSTGQLLSIPFLGLGLGLITWSIIQAKKEPQ
jgi:phosphatidylglycerol---prolipoprotein diacylglyceryl transferase